MKLTSSMIINKFLGLSIIFPNIEKKQKNVFYLSLNHMIMDLCSCDVFLSDLALSHYDKLDMERYEQNSLNIMPKLANPLKETWGLASLIMLAKILRLHCILLYIYM